LSKWLRQQIPCGHGRQAERLIEAIQRPIGVAFNIRGCFNFIMQPCQSDLEQAATRTARFCAVSTRLSGGPGVEPPCAACAPRCPRMERTLYPISRLQPHRICGVGSMWAP
jgi:hypothetical protein